MNKALIPLALAACFNANAANSDYFLVVPLAPLAAQASTTGAFSLSSSTLNYSNVQLGSNSAAQLTIKNTGSLTQTLGTIAVSQNPTEFSVVHNCPAMLSTGASCSATVTYSPAANTSTGQLTVAMDPAGTKTVALRGSSSAVEAPAPEPEPTPEPAKTEKLTGAATQDLGSLFVGDSNSTTFTLRNDGDGAAVLSYGNLPATVTRSGDCGASLAAGAACSVTLNWTPTAAGALAETLTISAANSTVDLKVTGVAVAKTYTATASATSLDFGSVNTGSSPTQTVTLTNTGNQPLTLANVGSGLSAPYSVSDDCGASLAVGASCTASVTYTPTAAGAHNQTLTLGMGAAGNKTVALTGSGQAAEPLVRTPLIKSIGQDCGNSEIGACVLLQNTSAHAITGAFIDVDRCSQSMANDYPDGEQLFIYANTGGTAWANSFMHNGCDVLKVNIPSGAAFYIGLMDASMNLNSMGLGASPTGMMEISLDYADGGGGYIEVDLYDFGYD